MAAAPFGLLPNYLPIFSTVLGITSDVIFIYILYPIREIEIRCVKSLFYREKDSVLHDTIEVRNDDLVEFQDDLWDGSGVDVFVWEERVVDGTEIGIQKDSCRRNLQVKNEQTDLVFNGVQGVHVFWAQLEVKDGDVLDDSVGIHTLRDSRDAVLSQVAEQNLRSRLVVLGGQLLHNGLEERVALWPDAVRTSSLSAWRAERRVGSQGDAEFLAELLQLGLWPVDVALDLLVRWLHFGLVVESLQLLGAEVGHSKGLKRKFLSFPILFRSLTLSFFS